MLSSVRAMSRRALIVARAGVLALSTLPAAAAESLEQLMELNARAWSGEPELLAETYESENQVYTIEGLTDYASVLSAGGPIVLAGVDLPAPEGELRWANFNGVVGGTLCVFWAQDDLITRHDCVVPANTAVPERLVD